jgi:serine/threonine-protein kinase HipA
MHTLYPPLNVFIGKTLVGTLHEGGNARAIEFYYANEWRDNGYPISVSLPLDGGFSHDTATNFFDNMLPESSARDRIAKEKNVPPYHLLAILNAIGRDCAGALCIIPGSAPLNSKTPPIDATHEICRRINSDIPIGSTPRSRISLAGAQDKIAVILEYKKNRKQKWSILLPQDDRPTTHILKPWSAFAANEYICNQLAKSCGLNVPVTNLFAIEGKEILAIDRYDRSKSKPIRRIHQEDFCQALGLYSGDKYQHEDWGITLSDIAGVLLRCGMESSLKALVEITAFNIIIGNGDAHAKNFSLLYNDKGPLCLAPFYDLISVPVINFTHTNADYTDEFALYFGGARLIDEIREIHFEKFALDVRASISESKQIFSKIADSLLLKFNEAMDTVTRDITTLDLQLERREYIFNTMEALGTVIAKNVRALQRNINLLIAKSAERLIPTISVYKVDREGNKNI